MKKSLFTVQELALCGVTMIWGGAFRVIRLAMQECGPFWFVCLRFGAASLALALVSLPVLKRFTRREIWGGIVIGVTVYVEYSLQTAGLAYIEASRSAFITAFYVPLVPLFEWLIMRRRPGRMALIGLALAFPGVILLSGMDVSGGLGRGELLTIGCAIVYALEIIVIAMIVPGTDPRRVTLVELVVTALLAGASMPPEWRERLPLSLCARRGHRPRRVHGSHPERHRLGAEKRAAHQGHTDLHGRARLGRRDWLPLWRKAHPLLPRWLRARAGRHPDQRKAGEEGRTAGEKGGMTQTEGLNRGKKPAAGLSGEQAFIF